MSQSEQVKDMAKSKLGFWIYLMTDCIIFASLFAVYAVLRNNTNGGPGANELFNLPYVLVETILLLTSSLTSGLITYYALNKNKTKTLIWASITFMLGLGFLLMELIEFSHLAHDGNSWEASAFLSSYFTLVGTHGLHILIGLIWLAVLCVYIFKKDLNYGINKRLTLFSIFWHFLDIVWIFIFSIVYLLGAIN